MYTPLDYPGLLSLAHLYRDRSDAADEAALLEQSPTDVGALNRLRMQQGAARAAVNPQWDAWFEAVRQVNPRGENTPFGARGSSLNKLPTSPNISMNALREAARLGSDAERNAYIEASPEAKRAQINRRNAEQRQAEWYRR